LGVALAWAIVLLQLTCSLLLVFGKLVVPACIGHIAILGPGIALDHARKGWFVVGPGKGGMEYSVLLIACLIAVLYAYWPWQNPRPVLKPSK
jgi:putative oxidoreductase